MFWFLSFKLFSAMPAIVYSPINCTGYGEDAITSYVTLNHEFNSNHTNIVCVWINYSRQNLWEIRGDSRLKKYANHHLIEYAPLLAAEAGDLRYYINLLPYDDNNNHSVRRMNHKSIIRRCFVLSFCYGDFVRNRSKRL